MFTVTDTKKTPNGQFIHTGTITEGEIALGKAHAEIDTARRAAIARNHSSVHLLQAALRKVLGTHVEQAGSYVDEHIGRFDFTHGQAVTKEELMQVEKLVNEEILKGDVITCTEMPIEEARKTGAMALFGEKYGDTVRVIRMGGFSAELCGGTHLDNTAKAGLMRIVSESSVAAGVRRIEIITGMNVLEQIYADKKLVESVAASLKAPNLNELEHRAEAVMAELRDVRKALEAANAGAAVSKINACFENAVEIDGVRIVKVCFEGIPVDTLRGASDSLIDKNPDCIAVLATVNDGKVLFTARCGRAALGKGANAGKLLSAIAPIVGGGGGGRPDSASCGGKCPDKLPEALDAVDGVVRSQIGG